MTDPLRLSCVRLTDATPPEVRCGLLAYLVIELAGGLVLEGATLRRSREGRRYVSFPRNQRGYPYIWLRTTASRRNLEGQVFGKLGISPRSDSPTPATPPSRRLSP